MAPSGITSMLLAVLIFGTTGQANTLKCYRCRSIILDTNPSLQDEDCEIGPLSNSSTDVLGRDPSWRNVTTSRSLAFLDDTDETMAIIMKSKRQARQGTPTPTYYYCFSVSTYYTRVNAWKLERYKTTENISFPMDQTKNKQYCDTKELSGKDVKFCYCSWDNCNDTPWGKLKFINGGDGNSLELKGLVPMGLVLGRLAWILSV